jgi:hypothetical protein
MILGIAKGHAIMIRERRHFQKLCVCVSAGVFVALCYACCWNFEEAVIRSTVFRFVSELPGFRMLAEPLHVKLFKRSVSGLTVIQDSGQYIWQGVSTTQPTDNILEIYCTNNPALLQPL